MHISIRGWRSHSDELSSYLHALPEKPKLIALNETFVNRSVSVFLPGYKIVGRRDRVTDEMNVHIDNLQSWGGILLFVSEEFDGAVVEISRSTTAERLWFTVHCDAGPFLLCICYRPPAASDISSISTLTTELDQLREGHIGTAIVGDLNCHNSRWLRYSSCVSVEGRTLHRFSMESRLHQLVKEPTRGDHLLDLVLSDLGDVVSTRVFSPIADHNLVFVRFGFTIQLPFICAFGLVLSFCRLVWSY